MMLKHLSFEDAVKLFKGWGFQVEPGPQPDEVTLIMQGDDYRTYAVHPAAMLPEMAKIALFTCWRNGAILRDTESLHPGLTYA
ncbi:MAG: hypothetical protein JW918_12145 [Anaerolineae bacterium]|nr:hypothetical protein [Anaerolineae bacterium]